MSIFRWVPFADKNLGRQMFDARSNETTSSAQFWLFSPHLDAASTDTMLLRISLLLIAVASEEGKWPGCLEGGIAYTNLLEPWWIRRNRLNPTGTKTLITNFNFLTFHDCSMVQVSSTVHHGMPLVPAHHMTLWTRAPWMPTSHKDISDAYEKKHLVQEPNGGYLANAKACQDRCCVLTKFSCV